MKELGLGLRLVDYEYESVDFYSYVHYCATLASVHTGTGTYM